MLSISHESMSVNSQSFFKEQFHDKMECFSKCWDELECKSFNIIQANNSFTCTFFTTVAENNDIVTNVYSTYYTLKYRKH